MSSFKATRNNINAYRVRCCRLYVVDPAAAEELVILVDYGGLAWGDGAYGVGELDFDGVGMALGVEDGLDFGGCPAMVVANLHGGVEGGRGQFLQWDQPVYVGGGEVSAEQVVAAA